MALCRTGMNLRTYDRWRADEIKIYEKKIDDYANGSLPLMVAFDNYNRSFGSPRLTLERKTPYQLANFTVFGYIQCGISVDCHYVKINGSFSNISPISLDVIHHSLPESRMLLAEYTPLLIANITASVFTIMYVRAKCYCS